MEYVKDEKIVSTLMFTKLSSKAFGGAQVCMTVLYN
jgi:hypothetical protein